VKPDQPDLLGAGDRRFPRQGWMAYGHSALNCPWGQALITHYTTA
jgi:hypothetical protein